MPRTSAAKIVEWGTPPEPEPTGWEAVAIALRGKPGKWANVGDYSAGSARKISTDKLADFETRTAPRSDGRVDLWARFAPAAEIDPAQRGPEAFVSDDAPAETPNKARQVKRGGVV